MCVGGGVRACVCACVCVYVCVCARARVCCSARVAVNSTGQLNQVRSLCQTCRSSPLCLAVCSAVTVKTVSRNTSLSRQLFTDRIVCCSVFLKFAHCKGVESCFVVPSKLPPLYRGGIVCCSAFRSPSTVMG